MTDPTSPSSPSQEPAEEDLLSPSFLRRLERVSIVATRLYPGSRTGERISKAKGAGMEFSEHKQYSPGDDFRAVDWNVFARTDHLYLKTFETEMNLYVYVIVDVSASMAFGTAAQKLRYAKQLAAALGYVTMVQGDNLAIHVMNDGLRESISTARSRLRPNDVLGFCRTLEPGGQTDFVRSLQAFSIHTNHPGMVMLISDFLSEGDLSDALRHLVYSGFGVIGFHVVDPWEEDPTLSGEVDLEDLETGRLSSVTVRRGTIGQLRDAFHEHSHEVNRAFATYEASCFHVRTDQPIDKFVLEDLRHAGIIE